MGKTKKGRPKKIVAIIPPESAETQVPQTPITPVTISLKIGDKTYESKGATILEALSSLERPEKIMLKGLLTLTQGDKSLTRMFFPVRLKRLFYNKYFKEIQAKYLAVGLRPLQPAKVINTTI